MHQSLSPQCGDYNGALRNEKLSSLFPVGGDGGYDWCIIPTRAKYEPPHDKTNKVACAPSENSDQPGHPPSLIRVFAVRMKKPWVLSYALSAQ